MNELLAIPVADINTPLPEVSAHFGHCAGYILVSIRNSEITHTATLPAMPHEQGGCMAPVGVLAQKGVTALLAGGMGMRPLNGFQQAGITVYKVGLPSTIDTAISSFLKGHLPSFSMESVCQGGSHCGGHDHSHGEHPFA